jgi:glycosyltransferase involved in cell wall biosynthesis
MRIAFLGPSPSDTSGVTYATTVLLRALQARGLEIDVYTNERPTVLGDLDGLTFVTEPLREDAVFRALRRAPLLKFGWGQSQRALAHRRLTRRLVAEHATRRYDVVYQFSQPELLSLRAHRHELPPIVVHPQVHAAGELRWHRRESDLARACEPRARTVAARAMLAARAAGQRRDFREVAAVICPSDRFADELARDYGVPRELVHVVPNPIDLDRFRRGDSPTAYPREILFVSRFAVRKGVEMVVELSRRLADLEGSVQIRVVGDGSMWSNYTPLLRGLDPRVAEAVGYVQPHALPEAFAGASLVVQPSHYEPFALTVGESLAAGTPVVVSDRVGAAEWLSAPSAGIFAAGDADAFEAAVRAMLERMETSEADVRAHARTTAESSFAPSDVAARVEQVLSNITPRTRRRRAAGRRLLVVSHPCVVPVNQSVYAELQRRGWEIAIVVPSRWRHEYSTSDFAPSPLPGLERSLRPLPVALPGRPQRHAYLARPSKVIRDFRPDVVFAEQEPFSVAALQWGTAAARAGIPFGVQAAENLDRPFSPAARAIRRWILPGAAFVAARSPAAARLAVAWGARGSVEFAPHAVPTWRGSVSRERADSTPFTVGYAGRLVPEKGIDDLLAAIGRLDAPVRLLVAGGGPLLPRVEAASRDGVEVEVLSGLAYESMGEVLDRMDVLVLPSRTTPTWAEQFGRVLVEAMSRGVPVVGSDSGEIPWVIEVTGGGIAFPEGDVERMAAAIASLRGDPALRAELGRRGAEAVDRLFTVSAATDSLERLIEGAL